MANLLATFLGLLKVKHTRSFTEQYFNEHPHRNNLYGVSKMLSDYGVANGGVRIENKEQDLSKIETPFIAQFSGDFVAVSKVEGGNVFFIWKGLPHTLEVAKFIEAWTGIVLLTEASEKSIEPDYKEHRKVERLSLAKKAAALISVIVLAALAFVFRHCEERSNPVSL
jgi:ABC-type bacteriocin/lantibiotic exporter with double-glycine peptidase domain